MKALVLVVMVLIVGCTHRVPIVAIAPGLHPSLTPAGAEQLAREALDAMHITAAGSLLPPEVLTITAIPGGPSLSGYLAGVSWIVEVRGDFVERDGFRAGATSRHVSGVRVHISDDERSVISVNYTD